MVPLDGSRHAEHAIPWAIQIATLSGARLRLLHVHPRMHPSYHGRMMDSYHDYDRLLWAPMEEYMSDIAREIGRAAGLSVFPLVVSSREVMRTLTEIAGRAADVIIMATRGRTPLGRLLTGSALDAVLHSGVAPVLHVRGYSCPVDLTARPSLQRGLVAVDDAGEAGRLLEPVAAIGEVTAGAQAMLRVVPERNRNGSGVSPDDRPEANLEKLANAWRARMPHVDASVVVTDSSPRREILRQAELGEADFIAVAPRRRGRLKRLLRPGVFDHLVRHSRIPVLAVAGPNAETEAKD